MLMNAAFCFVKDRDSGYDNSTVAGPEEGQSGSWTGKLADGKVTPSLPCSRESASTLVILCHTGE